MSRLNLELPRIFLDMDGVLTAWSKAAHEVHGLPPLYPWRYTWGSKGWDWHKEAGLNDTTLFAPMGRKFWANIGWTPEGKHIIKLCLDAVGYYNICLLSSPGHTDGSIDGRFDWINRELPKFRSRTLLGNCKDMCSHSGAILIDDNQDNVDMWQDAGGIGILVPRPWNNRYELFKMNEVLEQVHFSLSCEVKMYKERMKHHGKSTGNR